MVNIIKTKKNQIELEKIHIIAQLAALQVDLDQNQKSKNEYFRQNS